MGRNLACGIATKIQLYKKGGFENESKKSGLLEELKKSIDLDFYDIEEYEDGYVLNLKKEAFDNNIHDLIKEISPYISGDHLLWSYFDKKLKEKGLDYTKFDFSNFNKKDYPLELVRYPEDYEDKCYAGLTVLKSDEAQYEDSWAFESFTRILLRGYEDYRNVRTGVKLVDVWMNIDKELSEDPTMNLYYLNLFSRAFFKSRFSKCLVFYILG